MLLLLPEAFGLSIVASRCLNYKSVLREQITAAYLISIYRQFAHAVSSAAMGMWHLQSQNKGVLQDMTRRCNCTTVDIGPP